MYRIKQHLLNKLKNDNRGLVFLFVLVVVMVMMTITINIIHLNATQTMVAEEEVKRINAEMVLMGEASKLYMNYTPNTYSTNTTSLDELNYISNVYSGDTGDGTFGTDSVTVSISY